MTEQQEKDLLESVTSLKATLTTMTPIVAKVTDLEKTLAAKDAEITELKKGHASLAQGADLTAFKSAYPDVPEEIFHTVPADKRKDVADKIQSKVKALSAKTPLNAWEGVGGIGPTGDAEIAAANKAAQEQYAAKKKEGDVHGMLKASSGAVVDFLRQTVKR